MSIMEKVAMFKQVLQIVLKVVEVILSVVSQIIDKVGDSNVNG